MYIYTHIFVLYFCTPTSLPSEKKLYVGCLFIDRIREGPSYCNWGNRAFWPFKLLTFPWVTQCGFPTALISVALNLMPSAWSASFHGVSQPKKRVAHTLKTHIFVAYHVKRGFLPTMSNVGFLVKPKKLPGIFWLNLHLKFTKHFHRLELTASTMKVDSSLKELTQPPHHCCNPLPLKTKHDCQANLVTCPGTNTILNIMFVRKTFERPSAFGSVSHQTAWGPLGSVQAFWNWRSLLGANSSVAKRSGFPASSRVFRHPFFWWKPCGQRKTIEV